MIETLGDADRDEAVEVIGQAFREHPHMPVDPSGRRSRLMVSTLFSTFAAAPDEEGFVGLLGFAMVGDCG